MTFFSVAQATRLLGIDAKTLHRWLSDAHLPLHCHPHDGRKKGLSEQQLQTLAHLHHRSAAPLSSESSLPISPLVPPLSDALLALPQELTLLQAQVIALHQQVAALSALFQQPVQLPPPPPTPAPQPSWSKHPPVPRPTGAKTPRQPTHVIPHVEYNKEGHYVVICPKRGLLPFEPDTPEWFAWVAEQDSFRFVGRSGHFTAHHEWRVPKGAWRAHRHIRNRVRVQRLAPNHELTIAVLEQAAQALQAHLM